ncbi:hypothetical protein U1Q18_027699 [Sarracenia purpurea var. burkii]
MAHRIRRTMRSWLVAETDLLPHKPTYKEALQGAAGLARSTHYEVVTQKSKGKCHVKQVQSLEDVYSPYGLTEGALSEPSKVRDQSKSGAEGGTNQGGGWKAGDQEGYQSEDCFEDVDGLDYE